MRVTRRQSFGGLLGMLLAPFVAPRLAPVVIGTGQLSEVALGWSTYNGDCMTPLQRECTVESIRQLGGFMSRSIDRQSAAMSGRIS